VTNEVLLGAIQVIAPSFCIAIIVLIDARIFGPYFALSSFITGADGMGGDWWNENPRLRRAVARRFIYPIFAGIALGLLGVGSWESLGVVGFLAAVLLLWPILFGGVPRFSSRRDWEIPTLYLTFAGAYTLLVPAGGAIAWWISGSPDTGPFAWLADQIVGSVVLWGGSVLTSAVFLGARSSLGSKMQLREQAEEAEYLRYQLQEESARGHTRRIAVAWNEHSRLFLGIGAAGALATVSALFFQNSRRRKE
jgi:hypothetical protein